MNFLYYMKKHTYQGSSSRTKIETVLHQDQLLRRFSQDEREREGARESFTKIMLKRPGFRHQADLIRSSNSYVCLPWCLEEPFIIPTCPIKTFVHTELRANMRWRLHACPRSCTSALLLLERLYTTSAHGKDLTSLHEDSHQHPTAINTVTALHDDKLTRHLHEATYSAPYLWFSCLVMPFLWEVCFTALRQLCTSSSIFQCFKLKSIRLCFWTTTKVIST